MYIEYLRLTQYKRLMLSHINLFEYRPKASVQLILGTNGSGKSSVLAELNPLPSHHSNFGKGGEKEFHCRHKGRQYKLLSRFTGGSGAHTFEVDGEDLNPGRTFAIQKDLVRDHFGLTQEIVDILTGKATFTGMSTAKRREWLTRLSPTNLDYVFNVYNKVRSAHRDQLGVIKHVNKRLTKEQQEVPEDSSLQQMEQHANQLTEKLNNLFRAHLGQTHDPFQGQGIEDRLQSLCKDAEALLKAKLSLPSDIRVKSREALQEAITQQQVKYHSDKSVLDHLIQEHQQLMDDRPTVGDNQLDPERVALLRQQRQTLTDELAHEPVLQPTPFPTFPLPVDRSPRQTLDSLYQEWNQLLQSIPNNENGYYSREKGEASIQRLKEAQNQHQQWDGKHNQLLQRLQRLKGCDTIECPNCQHHFQPGVNPKEITYLETQAEQEGEKLHQLAQTIETLKDYVEGYQDYLGYVRSFRNLVSQASLFQPLWDYCIEHRVMFRNPRDYQQAAQVWYDNMRVLIDRAEKSQKLDTLQHQLRYIDSIDQEALTKTDAKRQELEKTIEVNTTTLREQKQQLDRLVNDAQRLQRWRDHTQDLLQRWEQFSFEVREKLTHEMQLHIKATTNDTQTQLAHVKNQLTHSKLREGLLEELNQQQETAKRDHGDYGLLVKALSPTEGLIGVYLMGFMQGVVKLLNAIIARVWTHSLEVLPSKVEKDELDYKFPLNVNNGAVMAPDISEGSSAQKDIVNFAFVMLLLKFLKLEDLPLFLDELGSRFDEQHRINVIDMIENLLEMRQVEQVFFISHYASTHDAFTQAETCVLDPTNIIVPQVYNQHVTIH